MTNLQTKLSGIGWKLRCDQPSPQGFQRKPFMPRILQIFTLLPLLIRLFIYVVNEWWNGRGAFIDLFHQMKHCPFVGVPIGGLGSGSIGTDFRGGFNKFSIIPGIKEQSQTNIKANQFILTVRDPVSNEIIYQSLLTCADFKSSALRTWTSSIDAKDVNYRGLFPRAWRQFDITDLDLIIVQEQMSPIIAGNYEDSSFPLCLFNFSVINKSNIDYSVSITFTFRNGTGNHKWNNENNCTSSQFSTNTSFGATLAHTVNDMPVTYVIGAEKKENVYTSTCSFDPDTDGSHLWNDLKKTGVLSGEHGSMQTSLGIAVCSNFSVPAGTVEETNFSLFWHMPNVHFGLRERQYTRRYARFLAKNADLSDVIDSSFQKRQQWSDVIDSWQDPYLSDDNLPEWYKSALFNELYFLIDGSTVWMNYDEEWPESETLSPATIEWFKTYGRYEYMESWEYYMLTTYDVHFYASWALFRLWPALEMGIQLEYVDQINRKDDSKTTDMASGKAMVVKKFGRAPHDLGHPSGEPFIHANAYRLHDTGDWKDLNLKFVLLCWRDWLRIYDKMASTREESTDVLQTMYERSKYIVDVALSEWDADKDCMIENGGYADQTYDMWTMTGTSAYCGSLWLAAVATLYEMATTLELPSEAKHYEQILEKAKFAYIKKLWNGKYFKFDENPVNETTVMSDQMCGLWFYNMVNSRTIVDKEKISSALDSIYRHNVLQFENGSMGPVNGIKENGEVDVSSIQSEEVWTGTAYAVASFMILENKLEQGFATAKGVYESCWSRFGLQYQTPEAFFSKNYYRAIGYMRPLSIWSIQEALDLQREK